MDAPGRSATAETRDTTSKLRAALRAFPGQPFAVVDGGHFDDLPALFKRERLFARSLFLDQADVEVQKAGPWLLGLRQAPDAADKVLRLVGDRPAAVFWCCEAGEAPLHRHLRSINMARIPIWADRTSSAAPSTAETTRLAMFRHWDPRVLGALMPLLDAGQFARVLGPAKEIAFLAQDYGGVRRVVADPAGPLAPSGPLTIRSDQAEALNARRLAASHRRIAAHLRELEPEICAHITNEAMITHVAASDRIGRDLGIEGEAAHGSWAWLMLISHGRVASAPAACAYVARGEHPPDTQVMRLADSTADALKGWSFAPYAGRP